MKDPTVMGARMSSLNPDMEYLAWRVLPDTSSTRLGQDVITSLDQYAFPFLVQYGSLGNVIRTWESGVSYNLGIQMPYYLAGAYWVLGEYDRAMQLMCSRRDHYADKYKLEAKRLDDITRREHEVFIDWLVAQPRC